MVVIGGCWLWLLLIVAGCGLLLVTVGVAGCYSCLIIMGCLDTEHFTNIIQVLARKLYQ